jgi:SRSO17 transposase
MSRKPRAKNRPNRLPPASGRKPFGKLSAQAIEESAAELVGFHEHFERCFQRREQRQWSLFYLCGQLSKLERKNIEAMVLALHGAKVNAVRDLQRFMSEGSWNQEAMLEQHQRLVGEWLGEMGGVVIADGSGFPKKGQYSVGVAPQYCGHVGKIANSQQGVFLVYASSRGQAFLDERLYVPEVWFSATYQKYWPTCRIPQELSFRSEPELALEMITGLVHKAELPFGWVVADEGYGRNPDFCDGIAALGRCYMVEVPVDTRVWLRTPRVELPGPGLLGRPRLYPRVARNAPQPREVRQLISDLPKSKWLRRTIKQGSKGPIVAEFAFFRVTVLRDKLPGPRLWLVVRRSLGAKPEVKFYLSNAPTTCPKAEFVRVSGMRWPVETVLEEGKSEVGMDHYETRTWSAWHPHMIHTFVAHLFWVRLCQLWQKKSCPDHFPGSPTHRSGHRRRSHSFSRYPGRPPLSPISQPRRLLLSSQIYLAAASSPI